MNRGLPVLNLPEVAILGADQGARPLGKRDENVFSVKDRNIVVPRVLAPFGQRQESRPLGRSNTESPRFTDFLSDLTN